jgi:hypothetical protein
LEIKPSESDRVSWSEGKATHTLHDISVPLDTYTACVPETGEACESTGFPLSEVQDVPVDSMLIVALDGVENLKFDAHSVPLRLGSVLARLVETHLIDGLLGDLASDQVAGFTHFIGRALGGPGCGTAFEVSSCCTAFAESMASVVYEVQMSVFEAACEALVVEGAESLRTSLLMLDDLSGELQFMSEAPCMAGQSLTTGEVESIGSLEMPCAWNVSVVAAGEFVTFSSPFVAERQVDD